MGKQLRVIQEKDGGKNGKNYLKEDTKFSKAIKQYGWESFEHYILAYTDEKHLSLTEAVYISKFNAFKEGFNSTKGDGSEVSQEVRDKQSRAQIGHKVSEKTINHIKNLNLGKHLNMNKGSSNPMAVSISVINPIDNSKLDSFGSITECCKKLNVSRYNIDKQEPFFVEKYNSIVVLKKDKIITGKRMTDEQRKKLSEIKKQHNNINMFKKSVLMLDFETFSVIREFNSTAEAAKFIKQSSGTHIAACCRGERKYVGIVNNRKITWRYKNEFNRN